jgi:hypothetical protein
VGGDFSCALADDGSTECWGDDAAGQATPPADTFDRLMASGDYACGLAADGEATCWGADGLADDLLPAATFARLGLGSDHGCGLAADGLVQCWGDSSFNQAPQLAIAVTELSAGQVGQAYAGNVPYLVANAPAKQEPYSVEGVVLAVVAGSLPAGLALDANGDVTGIPTESGTFAFTVFLEDENGLFAEQALEIEVSAMTP